jgi:hypothetical protein
MKRIFAIVTAANMLACSATSVAVVPPELEFGRLGERTAFERNTMLAQAPAPPASPNPSPIPSTAPSTDPPPPPEPGETASGQKTTTTQPPAEATPGATTTSPTTPPPTDMQPDAPLDDPGEPDKRQRTRTALFWTGIALVAIGGAGMIGFSSIGEATEDKLLKGYDDGSLTRARDDQLRTRGELMNGLAIGSAGLALVGLAFSAIAFGVDWTRCGTLAKRRRRPCRDKK